MKNQLQNKLQAKKNPKFAVPQSRQIFTAQGPSCITISSRVISQTGIFELRIAGGVALVSERGCASVASLCGISCCHYYNQLSDYIVDETIRDTITSDLLHNTHDCTTCIHLEADRWFVTGWISQGTCPHTSRFILLFHI